MKYATVSFSSQSCIDRRAERRLIRLRKIKIDVKNANGRDTANDIPAACKNLNARK